MKQMSWGWLTVGLLLLSFSGLSRAQDDVEDELKVETVEADLGANKEGSRTDSETVAREEEAIKLDGMSVAEIKLMRESAEKHVFQAEVNRMMKLIINSLYRNKEVYLRELISNASDALDKIRFLSLTDKSQLDSTEELTIRIKADKENHVLHITDTGVGMTKQDLINNLGTIAKSGTADFLSKLQDASSTDQFNDLIGQFGVGFYSAFLVADKVVVTTKHNDDKQHIWESDASSFSISEDPRGDTLKRGTQVSLYLKEESRDFLEQDTVRELVKKYSQFINFNIYLWGSSTTTVEEPIEEDEEEATEEPKDEAEKEDDEEGAVEEEKEEEKPKTTKKVQLKRRRKKRSRRLRKLKRLLGIGSCVTSRSQSGPENLRKLRKESMMSSINQLPRIRMAP